MRNALAIHLTPPCSINLRASALKAEAHFDKQRGSFHSFAAVGRTAIASGTLFQLDTRSNLLRSFGSSF